MIKQLKHLIILLELKIKKFFTMIKLVKIKSLLFIIYNINYIF